MGAINRSPRTRWVAGLVALAAAGTTWLGFGAAQAAPATVPAQLTLSGVAASASPTGGSVLGVHSGDTVDLTAAAIPTAGFPSGLTGLLTGVVGSLTGFEVVITSGNLPGVASYPKTLKSTDKTPLVLSELAAGTYNFTYKAYSLTLLGAVPITLDASQLGGLRAAGIKLGANNSYVAAVVAADEPPAGGLSVQLPASGVQASAGPVGLKAGLPGLATPTLSVPTTLPTGGRGSLVPQPKPSAAAPKPPESGLSVAPIRVAVPVAVPQLVMPRGDGLLHAEALRAAGGELHAGYLSLAASRLSSSLTAPGSGLSTTAPSLGLPDSTGSADAPRTIELASSPTAPSGVPVVLAVVAVVALATVVAMYAKVYLLRRAR